jgi:dTDP-4-dehydrorhamnose reductase
MKVLILGATGMIGNALVRVLGVKDGLQVWGTLRDAKALDFFAAEQHARLLTGVDVEKPDALVRAMAKVRPDVVINCIGVTKHHRESEDPQVALPLNAVLPHRLSELCGLVGSRFIHVSTDCVFSGSKGNYLESDSPDAADLYGKSKYLGEVDAPHALTLRTSTIGHELQSSLGLLEWFLAQNGSCKGYARAIFSGLTSVEFGRVIADIVLERADLHGLYHVGAVPIDKHELLRLIARTYGKQIDIIRDEAFVIDRSLNSGRFMAATGYRPPAWTDLISAMRSSQQGVLNV